MHTHPHLDPLSAAVQEALTRDDPALYRRAWRALGDEFWRHYRHAAHVPVTLPAQEGR